MIDIIPKHRRQTISQAIRKAYQDADMDLEKLKPGIVPLYDLILSYPIRVDEIQDMTAQKLTEYLKNKTGQAISVAEDRDCQLAGYLYLHEYQGLLRGFILTEKRPSAAPIFRRRFSAAHELGHYLLHFLPLLEEKKKSQFIEPLIFAEKYYQSDRKENQKESEDSENEYLSGELSFSDDLQPILDNLGIDRDLMEAEADCFAGELLIPEKACYELAKRYQGRFGKKLDVLVGRLAPEFLVSQQAMKRRLVDLNIIENLPNLGAVREQPLQKR
ncbi:MAG: hypothetical protein Tsb0014_05230 [Pleurocapsa sp.]